MTRLNDTRNFAAKHLNDSKLKSKGYYDHRVKTHPYKIGDSVYVIKEPRLSKLDKMYQGPYQITDILEKHNVILTNDKGHRILKHIDKIKPAYASENSYSE